MTGRSRSSLLLLIVIDDSMKPKNDKFDFAPQILRAAE